MAMPLSSAPRIVASRPVAEDQSASRSGRVDDSAADFGKTLADRVVRARPDNDTPQMSDGGQALEDKVAADEPMAAEASAALLALLAIQPQPVPAESSPEMKTDSGGAVSADGGASGGMLAAMLQLQQSGVVQATTGVTAAGTPTQAGAPEVALEGLQALDPEKNGKPISGTQPLAGVASSVESGIAAPRLVSQAATIAAPAIELPGLDGKEQDVAPAVSGLAGFGELAAKGSGHAIASTAPAHEPPRVAEPVGSSRWGDAVAQRVGLMLGKGEQQIDMQLNPPHLGPMEVRLNLGNEQASVVFTSQHAAVREALAAATPKLTALLADQGIQLVDVKVASDSLQQQHHQQQQAAQQQSYPNEQGTARAAASYAFAGQDAGSVNVSESLSIRLPVARGGVSLYV